MKVKYVIIASLILLFSGCSTLKGLVGQRTVSPIVNRTNVVENVVITPAVTNAVATPSGEIVQVVVPSNMVTNWQTNVVTEVNPLWQQTIAGAKALNSNLNPTPTAPFVNIGLSTLSAVLAWFAAWQNRKRQRAEEKQVEEKSMVNTLIAAAETFKDPTVKKHIKDTAVLFGTDRGLHERVKAVTTSGPNP